MARPPTQPVGGPLDSVNDAFHAAYDDRRGDAENDAPVFIVLADALVIFHRGARREITFTPRTFHVIKSASHAPVALYALLHRLHGRPFDATIAEPLRAMQSHLSASVASLAHDQDLQGEVDALRDLHAVLDASLAFVVHTLASGRSTNAELEAFAGETGPALLRLIHHATRIQLQALDQCVGDSVSRLDEAERKTLQVVVTGDHQARVRSLGMQYFQARLGERKGADERVTYAEGVSEEADALALVGKRRLDAAIARAFFGDAKRLQRDVLGDAVHELLAEVKLPPIV